MKIVITKIQHHIITQAPVIIQITIFDPFGAEMLRTSLPVSMFADTKLSVGAELVLVPKEKQN